MPFDKPASPRNATEKNLASFLASLSQLVESKEDNKQSLSDKLAKLSQNELVDLLYNINAIDTETANATQIKTYLNNLADTKALNTNQNVISQIQDLAHIEILRKEAITLCEKQKDKWQIKIISAIDSMDTKTLSTLASKTEEKSAENAITITKKGVDYKIHLDNLYVAYECFDSKTKLELAQKFVTIKALLSKLSERSIESDITLGVELDINMKNAELGEHRGYAPKFLAKESSGVSFTLAMNALIERLKAYGENIKSVRDVIRDDATKEGIRKSYSQNSS